MTHTHLIFVVLLLLLFSPSLLCSDAEVKIIGGAPVPVSKVTQYLPVVSIFLSYKAANETEYKRLCGGSAIKPFAILTSLSCVRFYDSKDWKGATEHIITISFTNQRELPYSVSFDNITVILHEDYNPASPTKIPVDMALVFLPKNLTVMYSTLSEKAAEATTKVTVAGWGKTDDNANKDFPIFLNQIGTIATDVVDIGDGKILKLCQGNKPLYNDAKYIDGGNFYCLKTTANAGPCVGDFGGPVYELRYGGKNTHVQVGIIIETVKDYCKANNPGEYFPVLRVDKFSSWIETNLKKYNYLVPVPVSSSGLIFFSPVLLGLSALVSLFLL